MDPLTRAEWNRDQDGPLHHLTTRQRRMLEAIDDYQRLTGEACSASYLSRRFALHHSTVQKHLFVLHRKGWLKTPNAPAFLTRRLQ